MIEFNNKKLEKKVEKTSKEVVNLLNSKLKKAKCLLGGSVAKGTYLYDDIDFDLFIMFEEEIDTNYLKNTLKKIFPNYAIKTLHGTRDYFQIEYKGFTLEFVPTLYHENPNNCENSIDISVFHIEWFLEKKKKIENLSNEVRKTKLFFKSNYLYGAESHIGGFSGHVIDSLIVYYKSFNNLIESAKNWSEKVVIDVEKHYSNSKEIFNNLSSGKLYSPLILVDPVLKSRNAAAALSKNKFDEFIYLANEYFKSPSLNFFKKTEPKIDKSNTLVFDVKWKDGNKDVSGSKVKKIFDVIKYDLKEKNYEIKFDFWNYENSFWILLNDYQDDYVRRGPPLNLKTNVKKFKSKHDESSFFKEDGRIFANIKRKKNPFEIVLNRSDFIRERVKELNIKYFINNNLKYEKTIK